MPTGIPSVLMLIAAVVLIVAGIGFANLFLLNPADRGMANSGSSVVNDTNENGLNTPAKTGWLDNFNRNIVDGGPPKDGIPAIDKPKYISALEGDKLLKNTDIVFGINYKGVQKAFPRKMLVWHEIVNDVIKGEKISVTYCPLTGTSIGLKGANNSGVDFGTSGKLVNSNLVMYDRQTNNLWPQILGISINGADKGDELGWFPVYWTTWGQWKNKYPDTLVLSENTGFLRPYDNDPYGSYNGENTYYQTGGPFFPLMAQNNKLPPKQVIVGIKLNNSYVAVPKDLAKSKRNITINLANKTILAVYDYDLDSVNVFEKDSKDPVTSFDAMWFAWYAFYPETEVYLDEG
ncbi:MAG: DUF3179 domain-containing protein [Candidatus Aenigmarchaeota archaeon]|nr:DUF3179 domain-containing protein [Candidatus Aenigmarchaeota archaeon]